MKMEVLAKDSTERTQTWSLDGLWQRLLQMNEDVCKTKMMNTL
jgi:hypothetical protein